MSDDEIKAIELMSDAALLMGWSMFLHCEGDDVQAISVGKAALIDTLRSDVEIPKDRVLH